jgi:signal transduction histidine kinase
MGLETGETQPGTSQQEMPKTHKNQGFWARLVASGLRRKLIIPYMLLTLLLAAVGTYVVTRLVASSIEERFINRLKDASQVSTDSIARRERKHLENLRSMVYTTGVPEAVAGQDINQLNDLLYPLLVNTQTDIISVLDTRGQEFFSLGYDKTANRYIQSTGQNFSNFEPVQKILDKTIDQSGDKFVGIHDTSFGPAFFTAAPIPDAEGNLTGVLMIGTYLSNLLADAKNEALADVALFNQDGSLIATTLTAPDEGFGALEAAAQGLEGGTTPVLKDVNLYNRDYRVLFTPLDVRNDQLGWMGAVLSSGYVTTAEVTSRMTFALIFTIGTAAVIIIGYLLSQSIARPILKLRTVSQEVAAGNLNQTVGIQRNDEIGELAVAFDQMTLQLRERTEEAARLYAETVQRNKELATINARLQSMQLQLIQAEKLAAVGQLTAGIVHDVKNPLAVIKGLSELMLGNDLTPEEHQNLTVIHESSVKANAIVTDLLKFARQSTPEKKFQDLRETVDASLRLTAYLSRKANIEVIKDLPDHPVLMWYDSQQLEQVFINIIDNAIHAMADRGILRVSLVRNDNTAIASFQDSGVGIPPENLSRIFDPFFTTKPEGQGTGLGLSVSYGIISNHNGHIQVESNVGKGSTFTIILPIDLTQPQGVG